MAATSGVRPAWADPAHSRSGRFQRGGVAASVGRIPRPTEEVSPWFAHWLTWFAGNSWHSWPLGLIVRPAGPVSRAELIRMMLISAARMIIIGPRSDHGGRLPVLSSGSSSSGQIGAEIIAAAQELEQAEEPETDDD